MLALGDPQQAVRKQAFDGLKTLGMDPAALAAEALATGQRDTGALGLALLAQQGKGAAGLKVLEDVLLTRDDGLEQEAAKLLAELLVPKPAKAADAPATTAKPADSPELAAARREACRCAGLAARSSTPPSPRC